MNKDSNKYRKDFYGFYKVYFNKETGEFSVIHEGDNISQGTKIILPSGQEGFVVKICETVLHLGETEEPLIQAVFAENIEKQWKPRLMVLNKHQYRLS